MGGDEEEEEEEEESPDKISRPTPKKRRGRERHYFWGRGPWGIFDTCMVLESVVRSTRPASAILFRWKKGPTTRLRVCGGCSVCEYRPSPFDLSAPLVLHAPSPSISREGESLDVSRKKGDGRSVCWSGEEEVEEEEERGKEEGGGMGFYFRFSAGRFSTPSSSSPSPPMQFLPPSPSETSYSAMPCPKGREKRGREGGGERPFPPFPFPPPSSPSFPFCFLGSCTHARCKEEMWLKCRRRRRRRGPFQNKHDQSDSSEWKVENNQEGKILASCCARSKISLPEKVCS